MSLPLLKLKIAGCSKLSDEVRVPTCKSVHTIRVPYRTQVPQPHVFFSELGLTFKAYILDKSHSCFAKKDARQFARKTFHVKPLKTWCKNSLGNVSFFQFSFSGIARASRLTSFFASLHGIASLIRLAPSTRGSSTVEKSCPQHFSWEPRGRPSTYSVLWAKAVCQSRYNKSNLSSIIISENVFITLNDRLSVMSCRLFQRSRP